MRKKPTVEEEARLRGVSVYTVKKGRYRYYPDARRTPEQSCAGCEHCEVVRYGELGAVLQCRKIGIFCDRSAVIDVTGRCEHYERDRSMHVVREVV